MNAQQFLTWMRNPGQTSREESAQLDALLDSFPYFQSGHLLYIKNLHNQGSFLYNNQLKTAAAYAVNRKVLYNLITLKSTDDRPFDYAQGKLETGVVEQTTDDRLQTGVVEQATVEQSIEEEVSAPPKFPEKRFTKNPDEWEAGMLRQLQLLHHWQQTTDDRRQTGVGSGDGRLETGVEAKVEQSESVPLQTELPVKENKAEQSAGEEKKPDAKEEINTLLYVLVEPGASEDLPEEIAEVASETLTEENEATQWEVSVPAEVNEEQEAPVVVPEDPVQQEILVEAIHSTFELEVDDKIPSVDELKPFRLEPIEEAKAPEPVAEEKSQEEVVVTGMEMSFSQWLQEVDKSVSDKSVSDKSVSDKSVSQKSGSEKPGSGKQEGAQKQPGELPKTALTGDKLIEQFIKEEPRIQVKKSGFFNPVNMAKKSVQESDEFITETLARIYAKQGNTVKAIRAYQKLSLKFPEKTAYFAALIEELKRTPNK